MQPQDANWSFLFAALPDTVEYYVEAKGVRSKTYRLVAVALPGVKNLRVTYEYPKWAGLNNVVEDPGGDLRAIKDSVGVVDIETDKLLQRGVLVLDDGTQIPLERRSGNWLQARVPITKDGLYYVAAIDDGEAIRLTEDGVPQDE